MVHKDGCSEEDDRTVAHTFQDCDKIEDVPLASFPRDVFLAYSLWQTEDWQCCQTKIYGWHGHCDVDVLQSQKTVRCRQTSISTHPDFS